MFLPWSITKNYNIEFEIFSIACSTSNFQLGNYWIKHKQLSWVGFCLLDSDTHSIVFVLTLTQISVVYVSVLTKYDVFVFVC